MTRSFFQKSLSGWMWLDEVHYHAIAYHSGGRFVFPLLFGYNCWDWTWLGVSWGSGEGLVLWTDALGDKLRGPWRNWFAFAKGNSGKAIPCTSACNKSILRPLSPTHTSHQKISVPGLQFSAPQSINHCQCKNVQRAKYVSLNMMTYL